MKKFLVRVSNDHPYETVRVAGRAFSKHDTVVLNEIQLTVEVMSSPALDISPLDEDESDDDEVSAAGTRASG